MQSRTTVVGGGRVWGKPSFHEALYEADVAGARRCPEPCRPTIISGRRCSARFYQLRGAVVAPRLERNIDDRRAVLVESIEIAEQSYEVVRRRTILDRSEAATIKRRVCARLKVARMMTKLSLPDRAAPAVVTPSTPIAAAPSAAKGAFERVDDSE